MSMFMCVVCGDMRDSDDGCEEAPSPPYNEHHGLICHVCVDEVAEQRQAIRGELSPDQQRIIDAAGKCHIHPDQEENEPHPCPYNE